MNYASLVNDIVNTMENDEPEFLACVPNFIDTTEQRLVRELDTYGYSVYASVAVSAATRFVTKPTDFRVPLSFTVVVSGSASDLYLKTEEFCRQYWPVYTSVGVPGFYANRGSTQFLIVPTPLSTYDGELNYVARPPALSSATSTNWNTDFASDALFYGSMAEANRFAKNWNAAQQWDTKFAEAVSTLTNEARRTRRDDQQPNNNVVGTNTLTGAP